MTDQKRAFIQKYLDDLNEAMLCTEDINFNAWQNGVVNLLSEIVSVLSADIPEIANAFSRTFSNLERDANTISSILKYALLDDENMNENKMVFISHRSTDKDVVKLLEVFLCLCGVSSERIFASSLPGNDVKENISLEVKAAIKNSCVQIVLLSQQYYESAYCLNEAGIMWYRAKDCKTIVIAMPEINEDNMLGFLNNDFKLRHLNSRPDLNTIIDIIAKADSDFSKVNNTKLNANVEQMIKDYAALLKSRAKTVSSISKDELGYYTVEIEGIFDDPGKPHRFYLIKGLLNLDEDTSSDKSHWICDWNKKEPFNIGDRVRFKVHSTKFELSIMHGNKRIYDFRNITPEDIQKI